MYNFSEINILFIAPLPPPIDGQSKASKAVYDILVNRNNKIFTIDLRKKKLKNPFVPIIRIWEIISVLFRVSINKKKKDIIYVSLAESFFGNLRDLCIYLICYKQNKKIFIHMLGGAGMKTILEKDDYFSKLNKFFLKRIGGVIVEGPLNYEMYSKIISTEKIHIVPNFAEEFLIVSDEEINNKFNDLDLLKIVYLSNLLPGKGYNELADAYISLNGNLRKHIEITFVGGFESTKSENDFLLKIKEYNNIKYIGKFIDGVNKRKLFCESHIFCLPTYYPFEGQPISILEAYATGCAVITTYHSGIPFIFSDKVNGLVVEGKSVSNLKSTIEVMFENKESLKQFAFNNRDQVISKFRMASFQDSIIKLFNSVI